MVVDQTASPGKMSRYAWSPLSLNSLAAMMVLVKLEGVSARGFLRCAQLCLWQEAE